MSFSFSQKYTVAWAALITTFLLVMSAGRLAAAEAASGPGEVVKTATDNIMTLVNGAPEYFDTDPERYFTAIGAELDKVVDFRGFARGVMGEYASSSRFKSLDKAGQEQLREQLDRFTGVLRDGLINTYGRGLMAFGGSRVELAETEFSPGSTRVASVTQRVFSEEGKIYTVKYQMGQYRDGSWQLRNMIIENINLGEIYRGQFEAAAKEVDGDLDYVIEHWDDTKVRPEKTDDEEAVNGGV